MSTTTKQVTGSDMRDAEAYNEMMSAAVDLKDVYVRNGYVAGASHNMLTGCDCWSMQLILQIASLTCSSFYILLYRLATRSVRDIDSNSRRSFLYSIPLSTTLQQKEASEPFIIPPAELPTKIKARIPSPSGFKLAILVEETIPAPDGSESNRFVFEIWTNYGHSLSNRIVLPKEKHGKVCTDFEWFGGISWSPDESALVYNAEIPTPKTTSFFDSFSTAHDGTDLVMIGSEAVSKELARHIQQIAEATATPMKKVYEIMRHLGASVQPSLPLAVSDQIRSKEEVMDDLRRKCNKQAFRLSKLAKCKPEEINGKFKPQKDMTEDELRRKLAAILEECKHYA